MKTTTALCVLVAAGTVLAVPHAVTLKEEGPEEPIGSATFWWKILISACLVLSGGAFAGYACSDTFVFYVDAHTGDSLTLGLMGLDELHLRVLAQSSEDEKEKMHARKGTTSASTS